MNILGLNTVKTNYLGALAGTLCMIHCLATPLIFVAKSCTDTCCATAPGWWSIIDFLFLLVSFFAIYSISKSGTKQWIEKALWISWAVLLILTINEKMAVIVMHKYIIYIPALAIISLHLYNNRYCKCADTACCTTTLTQEN